jgi:hypothetical protein
MLIYIIIDSINYRNKEIIFYVIVELIRTKSGNITKLIKASNDFHYTVIYKFIERSKWNAISVHQKFVLAVIKIFDIRKITFIIDDSIIYRSRKNKTVKGAYLYDHSNKSNRSRYVWGQNILMMAAVINIAQKEIALPVIIHLLSYSSDSKANKITSSAKMINIVSHFLKKHNLPHDNITVTFDSFFAKKRLVKDVSENSNFYSVFQVRRDAALFYLPPKTTKVKRGRKRIYGIRIIINKLSQLNKQHTLLLYGKFQKIHFREFNCKARFLKGQTVKAVYCRLGSSKKINLYISTDLSVSAVDILKLYEKRWKIEPLFNELKNIFSFKDIWMQTTSAYQKFLHLKLWAFVITQLASINNSASIETFAKKHLPWRFRKNNKLTITNGITQLALAEFLGLLTFRIFITKVCKIVQRNSVPFNSLNLFTNYDSCLSKL